MASTKSDLESQLVTAKATLTLSSANTYTGGTVIMNGRVPLILTGIPTVHALLGVEEKHQAERAIPSPCRY